MQFVARYYNNIIEIFILNGYLTHNQFNMLQDGVTKISKKIPVLSLILGEMNVARDKKRLEQLGRNLRRLREAKGLSMDQVAARCDVTKGNLSLIENGKKDFTMTTFLEIAKGLGLHPSELIDSSLEI